MQTLIATPRKTHKKSVIRSLRHSKKIPAVVYGKKTTNTPIQVDENDFANIVKGEGPHAIVHLMWGEGNSTVMIGEIQKDPLKNEILHIDFQEVDMNKQVKVEVPLQWVGEAPGVNEGGVLQQQERALEVRCMPTEIPDHIPVDISTLGIGDSLTVGDIQVPEKVEVQVPADTVLVSVKAPSIETDPLEPQVQDHEEPEIVDAKDGPGIDADRG